MIRRAPIETRINHERWLVSYSDFITLLFAFFVVMYSVSQMGETKFKELQETLNKTFHSDLPLSDLPQTENTQLPTSLAELNDIQGQLEEKLAGVLQNSDAIVSGNEDWVELQLDANLLFASGKSELSKEAEKIFRDIADLVAPYENAVEVAGHTDDIPISNTDFANNWELSSARAVSVVNWLAYHGVAPQRLSAVGYGEYRPVADNSTEEGRAQNRRVVLRVARERAEQPAQLAGDVFPVTEIVDDSLVVEQASESVELVEDVEPSLKPIKLENGGLLFTRDTDSPRARQATSDDQD